MRILVANSPRMYREVLALSILRQRPSFEVLTALPEDVAEAVERFAPHALVRDDGVRTDAPEGVIGWAGIVVEDQLNARICVNGRVSEIHDVSVDDLLAALDEIERLVSAAGQRVQASPRP